MNPLDSATPVPIDEVAYECVQLRARVAGVDVFVSREGGKPLVFVDGRLVEGVIRVTLDAGLGQTSKVNLEIVRPEPAGGDDAGPILGGRSPAHDRRTSNRGAGRYGPPRD
jgi:hypothetical protein